jgi:peptidyl-prolyl cis-trans isomerase SurA
MLAGLLFASPVSAVIVNGIACKVGKTIITIHEFNVAYEREKTQAFLTGLPVPSKKTVMDKLVDNLIMKMEAEDKGIVVTADELNELVGEVRRQNRLSEEEFLEELKKEKMSIDDLKEMIKTDLLKNRLISLLIGERANLVTDEEVSDFYNDPANRKFFITPASVSISQLFIKVPEDAPYKTVMEIKASAAEIAQKAREGTSFQELQQEYIEKGLQVKNVGSLGSFTQLQLASRFPEDAVETIFSTEAGGVTSPLWSLDGYSIIKVEDRKAEKLLSLESAQANIKSFLLRKKGEDLFNNWLAVKRNALNVEYMIDLE